MAASHAASTVPGDQATHPKVLLSFSSITLEKGLQTRAAEGDPTDFTSLKVSDSPSKACLPVWMDTDTAIPAPGRLEPGPHDQGKQYEQ